MKKTPPTPDVNANAPRPRHVSSDNPDLPTMDSPPRTPDGDAAGFDRATAVNDQDYRSVLPGSDDITGRDDVLNGDGEEGQGVDPEQYAEYWSEREEFPQQDDPDQEELVDEATEGVDEDTEGLGDATEGIDEELLDGEIQLPDGDNEIFGSDDEHPNDPENETLGANKQPDKR